MVPLDDLQTEILMWLGVVEPQTPPDKAAEDVKSSLRKNDVGLMCHLLRQLGTDRKYKGTFKLSKTLINSGELDPQNALDRLEKHLKNPSINFELQPKDPVDPSKIAPLGQGAIRDLWIDFDPA